MTGHVRKRGETWAAVLYLGRDPDTGKKRYKWYGGFRTKRDAERKLTELLHQLNTGTYVESPVMSMAEYLRRWLEESHKKAISEKTYTRYKQLVDLHILPHIGHIRLDRLQPVDVEALYTKLLEGGRKDRKEGGLHPRTVLHCHRVLHKALKQAVQWGWVGRNVCDVVTPPKPPKPKRVALTEDQAKALLQAAEGHRWYPLLVTALSTGMRIGELLGLRWEDVNLDAGVCYVRQSLKRSGRNPKFGPVKTHRSERPVTLGAYTVAILRQWKAQQAQERLQLGPDYRNFGLVFTTAHGTPLHPGQVLSWLKRLVRASRCPADTVVHSLRHTFATLQLRAGVALEVISEQLGHATLAITADIYTDYVPELHREAAQKIDQLLFSPKAQVTQAEDAREKHG